MQFVIPHRQRFRQHQPALVRNIESIKCLRVWIVDVLGDKFPVERSLILKPVPVMGMIFPVSASHFSTFSRAVIVRLFRI